MLEVQRREAQKGHKYSMPEISCMASPLWSNMTPEERKPYNDKALMSASSKGVEDATKKFTSLGVSYADVDAEKREFEEARDLMVATVKSTIGRLCSEGSLENHVFFVCHANYFYKNENQFYYPAEFALGAFNLQSGLLGTLHFFVDPGKIPLGFKFEAADWSSRHHGIPVCDPSWNEGIKDPLVMFRKVKDFIQKFAGSSDVVPPIYTTLDTSNPTNHHNAVRCAFTLMCDAANEDSSLFRVYCISHLFYEIRNKCSNGVPSVALMRNEIDKDVFSYARDLGCYFHEEKDLSMNCSLSVVTRWVYIICDHCCKHLGIKLILGRHVPKDTDLSERFKFTEDRYSTNNPGPSGYNKPLTIIDHGLLKEQRVEEKKAQDDLLRESENIRLPKSSYSNKMGAKFDLNGPSTSQSSLETPKESNDNEWLVVKGRGFGRGRGFIAEASSSKEPMWPVSGRGRAFRQ